MRRFVASAFIILIIPIIFPLFAHAYSQDDVSKFKEEFYNKYNVNISDHNAEAMLTEWENGRYLYSYATSTNIGLTFSTQANNKSGDNLSIYGGDILYNSSISTWNTNTNPSKSTVTSYYTMSYMTFAWGKYEDFNPIQIDFDNLYYSAQIPVPDIDVYMDSSNPYPSAGDAVWNASIEIGDNSEFYVQWGYKISWPTYIDLGLSGMQGDITYNYYGYLSSTYTDIATMQSLTSAVAQGASASSFQPMWESFYDGLSSELGLPEFGSSINAMSASMINNAKQYYIDYMMTQIPMYGNRLEVFARYFIIDEENGSRVVVGAWNHWNSKDGSRTKERPSNYIDNVALPGNIISNTDPDYQDNSNTFTSNGDSTGTPATIINNNYTPNYPDYPTVATYNHDNILLNFMDTAKQLPSFFGEFTGFLTVAFGFIPSWIWTIIGMGFTFSIVIMIIKVL